MFKKKFIPRTTTWGLIVCCVVQLSYGQNLPDDELWELSIDELMNITIVSASKKEERVFDAPLSSYTVTRQEIANSGATSIPEALRLCPGLIVRESYNGQYDVQMRGFDNLQRFTSPYEQFNPLTLVMIDNRPVFNYLYGFTLWESLPISLVDIDRIEIVKGASAPLYGPNAVLGVINIITNKPEGEGFDASGNVEYGTPNTFLGNLSLSNTLSERLSLTISGNIQRRDRHEENFYDFEIDQFVDIDDLDNDREVDDKARSTNKEGINAFLYFDEEDLDIDFSAGYHHAEVQGVMIFDPVPFDRNNNSYYFNVNSKYKQLESNVSYINGFDEIIEGQGGNNPVVASYDYSVFNSTLNYTFELMDSKLGIVPSFNYQRLVYDDTDYINTISNNGAAGGVLNGSASLDVLGGGLKVDYEPIEKLRLISALRLDRYNVPDDTYLSYQFMATFKATENILFRAVHARSNSGSFMVNSFQDTRLSIPTGGPTLNLSIQGNENLDLAVSTLTEIGVRWQLLDNVQLDLAGYYQKLEDLNFAESVSEEFNPMTNTLTEVQMFQNVDTKGQQTGLSMSLNWLPVSNLIVKPFVSFQKTTVDNLEGIEDGNEHDSTPNAYGGAYVNYQPVNKLNIGLSTYFMGNHTLYNSNDLDRPSTRGNIDDTFILNAKVSYQAMDKLKIYVNGRNIGSNSRQHYGTDRIEGLYLAGVSYNL